MTSLGNTHDQPPVARQFQTDAVHRSPFGLFAGALVLGLGAWLGVDALFRGDTADRLTTVAVLLVAAPLVVAFGLRPAVFIGTHRLRVRNPFRTIDLPWASVEGVRAAMSTVVHTENAGYSVWALPVSLRDRKKALRKGTDDEPQLSPTDRTVKELNTLAASQSALEESRGEPVVTWAYGILAPVAVGVLALAVLLVVT